MNNIERKKIKIFLKKHHIYKLFKKRFDDNYFNNFSEPRGKNIRTLREYFNTVSFYKTIFDAFYWISTPEGYTKWNKFHQLLCNE